MADSDPVDQMSSPLTPSTVALPRKRRVVHGVGDGRHRDECTEPIGRSERALCNALGGFDCPGSCRSSKA